MDAIDFWRLCTEYSVVQAALLITGNSPEEHQYSVEHSANAPDGYVAARTALVHAIRTGELSASVVQEERDAGRSPYIDVHETIVHVLDLDRFVKARGIVCPFFERAAFDAIGEFDPVYAQYPRKLDAAIKAWKAVTGDPKTLRGKTPKQALTRWLLDNAEKLRLTNKDGRPNQNAIEEISKVANWKPEGGAPRTPSSDTTVPEPKLMRTPPVRSGYQPSGRRLQPQGAAESFSADLDDEIPF